LLKLSNHEQLLLSGPFHHFLDVNGVRSLTIQVHSCITAGTIFQFSFAVKSDRALRKSQGMVFSWLYLLHMINADRQY
jgi:hypothetical protein